MAYIHGFAHDVFISYAHLDNEPVREGEKGWVEEFEGRLSTWILKRLGERVSIWRDPGLRKAELFDDAIREAVEGSAVVLSLITRRYAKSEYCAQEVEWFRKKTEAEPTGFTAGRYLRIFPVLLYNLPKEDWPEPCKGALGHPFYKAKGDDLGFPLTPDSDAFEEHIRDLVVELEEALGHMKESAVEAQAPDPGGHPGEERFKIFLAHPADVLGPTRRHLAAKLGEQPGIELLGDIPPPHDAEPHAQAVRRAIESADLSVHLLGDQPGEPIDEAEPWKTYPVEQARIGLDHSSSQLVLMPEEVDSAVIAESTETGLVRDLFEMKRNSERLEVVQTGRHQMLDEILAKRERIEEVRKRLAAAPGAPFITFIDLHSSDVSYATDLVGYLAQREITPIMIPAADTSPAEGMSLFLEQISRASLFLVFFGSVARDWVQHRLVEATKLIILNDLATKIGVYAAPPTKAPEKVRFSNYEVVNNTEKFDPTQLDSLLAKARESE